MCSRAASTAWVSRHAAARQEVLHSLVDTWRADIRAVFDRDPAVRSWLEGLRCYPALRVLMGGLSEPAGLQSRSLW